MLESQQPGLTFLHNPKRIVLVIPSAIVQGALKISLKSTTGDQGVGV
jgi:hypothetical protein